MNKRQMRREYRAFLGHYDTLHGLVVLADVRIRQLEEALNYLGIVRIETSEQANAVRDRIQSEHMKGEPRARMLWDVPEEIDLYVWAPLELFFCSAQAMIERYQYLKAAHPDIAYPSLDNYINDNRAAFDAVTNLRDWVIHPGYSRKADDAVGDLFREYEKQNAGHPYQMVGQLLDLYRRFLEQLSGYVA